MPSLEDMNFGVRHLALVSLGLWQSETGIVLAPNNQRGRFVVTEIVLPNRVRLNIPRFPQLTMDQLNDKQKPLGEQIMKVSSVGLGGPYNPMLRSPVFGQKMFDLLYYLRWQTSMPLKLNEFAILIIGRQWRSQVEWFAHAPLAIKAGLSPDIVAKLKANKRPSNMSPGESVVYDFVTELTTTHVVSDETFNRAKQLLGEQQVVDLTAVAGTYVTAAMILAMSEESVPPGKELPFKPGEP